MNYCNTDTTPCPPTSHTHQHPSSAKFAWGWRPLRTQMLPHHWGQVTFVVVQSVGHVQLFATLWTAAHQPSLSFTISLNLLKLMSIESVMPPNHLILCLLLLLLPSIFPSIRITSEHLFFLTSVKCFFFFLTSYCCELSSLHISASFTTFYKGEHHGLLISEPYLKT